MNGPYYGSIVMVDLKDFAKAAKITDVPIVAGDVKAATGLIDPRMRFVKVKLDRSGIENIMVPIYYPGEASDD